ncbi:hypothetical protein JCM3770_006940 [Rhodotorula araucariae]
MSPSRGAHRRSRARLVLVLLVAPVAAVSNADLIKYLGGTATGQTLNTAAYSLTMLANETGVLISLSVAKKLDEVGWVGWGRGTAMTDADILVLWPNPSSGAWTLSHRTASSTVMPTLVGSPADDDDVGGDASGQVRVVPALSSAHKDESPCVVTVERLLELKDADGYGGKDATLEKAVNQPVIYAYGTDNPGNSAQDTDLTQHALDAMGGTYVDLSAEFSVDTTAIDPPLSPVEGSSPSGGSSAASSGAQKGTSTTKGSSGTTTTSSVDERGDAPSATGIANAGGSSTGPSASSSRGSSTSSGAAWAFFAPLGALYARLGRGPMGPVLFPLHFKQQGFITTPLTLVAVGLALWAVKVKGGSSLSYPHKFYQVHLGLARYGVSDKVIIWAFYGCIALFTLLYAGSLLSSLAGSSPPAAPARTEPRAHHRKRSSSSHRALRRPHGRRKTRRRSARGRRGHVHAGSPDETSSGTMSGSDSESSARDVSHRASDDSDKRARGGSSSSRRRRRGSDSSDSDDDASSSDSDDGRRSKRRGRRRGGR